MIPMTNKERKPKMKNIFKTSKRSIAAILTLCILLGIAGTCVYAVSAMPEENPTATEKTIQELVPVMASGCENDDYYIEGEPDIPTGAMPEGDSVIGNYVSLSFLSFVVGLGYPDTGWYYFMQDYRLPNGQLVKYHIYILVENLLSLAMTLIM